MNIKKMYDLTHPLYHNCPGWPDFDPPIITKMLYSPKDEANVELMTINTHTGTHIDVPYHFCPEKDTLEKVPLKRFVGEGVVVDVSYKGDKEAITGKDLDEHASHVRKGDIMMLYTGRGSDRGFNSRYMKNWPAPDASGAQWIVDKGINMVGTDSIGMEMYGFPPDGVPVVHPILLGAEVLIAEEVYLEEVAKLGDKRLNFICLPLLLKGAGGCLARIIAFEEGP